MISLHWSFLFFNLFNDIFIFSYHTSHFYHEIKGFWYLKGVWKHLISSLDLLDISPSFIYHFCSLYLKKDEKYSLISIFQLSSPWIWPWIIAILNFKMKFEELSMIFDKWTYIFSDHCERTSFDINNNLELPLIDILFNCHLNCHWLIFYWIATDWFLILDDIYCKLVWMVNYELIEGNMFVLFVYSRQSWIYRLGDITYVYFILSLLYFREMSFTSHLSH